MSEAEESIRCVLRGDRSWALVHGSVVDYAHLFQGNARADLVYGDLPYCTGQDWLYEGRVAYSDKYASPEAWAVSMADLVTSLRDGICGGGQMIVHVDWRYSHLLRAEIARRIEPRASGLRVGSPRMPYDLVNEIVWRYRRMPARSNALQSVHDTLYVWRRRGGEPIFQVLYEPLAESTRKQWGTKKQKAIVKDGQRVKSSTGEEESPGVPMGDVWDLSIVAPQAKERTGYPTQKPVSLGLRLVDSFSRMGSLVVDVTCGSATMGEAALRRGRRFIGFDTSAVAVEVARARLSAVETSIAEGRG